MFKRVLFFTFVFLTTTKGECSHHVDLQKIIEEKHSQRTVALPDAVLNFLPEGTRDCEIIVNTNRPYELAAITIKYVHRTVEQLILKEKFVPQNCWNIKENDRITLRLERISDGSPFLSVDASRIYQDIFYNPLFTIPQLQHIAVNCMLLYFRTYMEVSYLNFGSENLKDFAESTQINTLMKPFRKSFKNSNEASTDKDAEEIQILNNMMNQYRSVIYSKTDNLFTLLFGCYSKRFMIANSIMIFFRPDISFTGPSTKEIIKSYLILTYELSYFSSQVEIDLLNLKAPLKDNTFRELFKNNADNSGIVFIETDKRAYLLEGMEKVLAGQPKISDLLRYAYILTAAASEKTKAGQEELKRELASSKLREQTLESKLASHELLSLEESGSKKKNGKKQKGQTAPSADAAQGLRKQLNKLNSEHAALKNEFTRKNQESSKFSKQIQDLEAELSKASARNTALENNQKEFLTLYNSMIERMSIMEKYAKELKASYDELLIQAQEKPEQSNALKMALEMLNAKDLGDVVENYLSMKNENELLNERLTTLRSANKLLGAACRELQFENASLTSSINKLTTDFVEQGKELDETLQANIALTTQNESIKRDLITLDTAAKNGAYIPIETAHLFADNVELDAENAKIKELNFALQSQVASLNEAITHLAHRAYHAEAYAAQQNQKNFLLQKSLKQAQSKLNKSGKESNYE